MDLGIAGRTALVTASSKGLGRGAARALAGEGVNVMLSARGEESLVATVDEINDAGGSAAYVVGDVTEADMPARMVESTVERFGSIDIVVANAGGPPVMRSMQIDGEALAKAVNDNFMTSVRLVQAAVAHMGPNGWGRICCITSSSIKEPIPTLSLSNAARVGLYAWAKTAARELPDGVTLNLVCPGMHATDRILDLAFEGRKGDPDDFGRIVAFLCSGPAAFVNGSAVVVDGGALKGLL